MRRRTLQEPASETTTMSSPAESKPAPSKGQKIAVNPTNDDLQAGLVAALKEEEELKEEFELLQQKMADNSRRTNDARNRTLEARKSIRAAGGAEFDSLLYVGRDSLSHVLKFVDIKSLGRCERACKVMKPAADPAWKAHEERQVGRHGSECEDVRIRVNRLFVASKYARQAEDASHLHRHRDYVHALEEAEGTFHYCDVLLNELYDDIPPEPCCFPQVFNHHSMESPQEFEFFARITAERGVLFEGFVPPDLIRSEEREEGEGHILSINFRHLDRRKWPKLQCFISVSDQIDESEMGRFYSMDWITLNATFIALQRGRRIRSRASTVRDGLVCVSDKFSSSSSQSPLKYDNESVHVLVEARSPRCPHRVDNGPHACRIVRLVAEKSGGSNFFGFKIQDGPSPAHT